MSWWRSVANTAVSVRDAVELDLHLRSSPATRHPRGTARSPCERDGYYAKDDSEHREASAWAGRGAEALGLSGPGRSGDVQGGPRRQGAGWNRVASRAQGPGQRHSSPSRMRRHVLRPEVRLPGGARRRRPARRGGARPGREAHARLGREERRGDPDAGPGDRPHGVRRQSTLTPRVWPARACGAGRAFDFTDAPPPPVR